MRVIFTCLQIWHFKKYRVWKSKKKTLFLAETIGSRNFLEVNNKADNNQQNKWEAKQK